MNIRLRRVFLSLAELQLDDLAEMSDEDRNVLLQVTRIFVENMERDAKRRQTLKAELEGMREVH